MNLVRSSWPPMVRILSLGESCCSSPDFLLHLIDLMILNAIKNILNRIKLVILFIIMNDRTYVKQFVQCNEFILEVVYLLTNSADQWPL